MELKNLHGKKVRELLVYPDYTDRELSGKLTGGNYSEGLASISAVMKQGGHDVKLLHLLYLHSEEEFKQKLTAMGEFDIIGFSIRTTAFPDCQLYVKWAKEAMPNALITAGSYHCTLAPEEVMEYSDIDALTIGDGEYAALELADKMSAGEDYTNILSMWFRMDDGSIKKNPVAPLFEDLDRLPIPDFELFDYDNLDSVKVGTAIVMMSRGCRYNCTYCGNSQFRNVYPNKKIYSRFRSPQNGILYLKTLLSKHPQIKVINFRDAIFNMMPEWTDEFLDLYTKEIHLPFTGNIRFDILTEDSVRKMKEAGCYTIDMGLESGDQEMRFKYLKRYMTDEMIINCSKWFHKYGIAQLTYNIIGLPHEDKYRALKTIKLNAKAGADRVIPNIFYPYPGTKLYDIAKEGGFIPEGGVSPDARVPLVQPQFPEHEVLYLQAYFAHFVRRYKWAYAMPEWLGKPYEKWLDARATGKHVPYKLLVKLHDGYSKVRNGIKNILIDHLPKVYMKLRVWKHRKKAKKVD